MSYARFGRHAGGERIQVSTECVQYLAKIAFPEDESTEPRPWNCRDPTRLDVKTLHRGDGEEENVNQDIDRTANARVKGVLSGGGDGPSANPVGVLAALLPMNYHFRKFEPAPSVVMHLLPLPYKF